MPGMDGLEALKIIMEQMPVPVLMVSSLTTESAQATMQAFDLGAVDFISKDSGVDLDNIKKIKDELIDKIKQIARSRLIQNTIPYEAACSDFFYRAMIATSRLIRNRV